MLNECMNIGIKSLELILQREMILFVKLAWKELLEAKISVFIPYSARLWAAS